MVWINRMLGELNFEEEELGYKLATAEHLARAREQLLVGDPAWTESLIAGLKHSNQLNWRVKDDLVAVARQQPEHLGPLLELLWTGTVSRVSFNAFVTRLHGLGGCFHDGGRDIRGVGDVDGPRTRGSPVVSAQSRPRLLGHSSVAGTGARE
ncbi:hypothetical protein E8P82_14800 [Arthrobacter echini]|uniref:Uncharacterized protein n=1 Tax=Arthrobacter echini TaxID=1529066 RepID=A0A4S5DZQ2_9MICC|nr:hypothetical protein [Arthrobacter echini]THJ64501.1 hypothetical protein E8P82_14800 [Arthrobacter echini]